MPRLKFSNIIFNDGFVIADVEPLELPPDTAPGSILPEGYDSDTDVAWRMLEHTKDVHSMNAVAYQNRGKEIAALLNQDWPGLNAYAHKQSDAIMWPGFGSLDVTIDSGRGGWYFRPDGVSKYGEGK